MFARTHTVALAGALGHLIDVQADVSSGTPGTTLVGRADAMLNEGRDRARMAVQNSGLDWPVNQRVTVLLSPADVPKVGTHYDLAIAVAVLAATGVLAPEVLGGLTLIGELALDGGLRPAAGVLPMVLASVRHGVHRVIVPETQVGEAMMVPGVDVLGMRSLAQVVAELRHDEMPSAEPVRGVPASTFLGWRGQERLSEVDMADLRGLADAKFAAQVAAAGGHHLLLSGPKGCGKTSVAERLPTLLPDLEPDVAVELTALRSLAGRLDPAEGLPRRPPYTAPHHDASKAALVGGGSGKVSPGLISLAHGGVVFLDEFPHFRADVIDALRDPMENGDITVSRGEETVRLPARALVVLAANQCACGNEGSPRAVCRCRATEKRDYQRRMSGPVLDRIDITRQLRPSVPGDQDGPAGASAEIREAVVRARARQSDRYAGTGWRLNSDVPAVALREEWPLAPDAARELDGAMGQGVLTHRAIVRVQRLAWTLADLGERERPGIAELHAALALRTGAPLPERLVRGGGLR
ncbi:YifB family Mg chelatase-like AAA ATPase [Nocardioides sp.]|uniref:YifB family Mg chelatase-like AAA ATPase n=1 Tax=Nocardioides sp. TaxID=35761 RepID=UPI00261F56AB|nr:YifB family Mg chelatase-like AAA ATPase [Nocardioides sp.]